jgi:hypothetical protein
MCDALEYAPLDDTERIIEETRKKIKARIKDMARTYKVHTLVEQDHISYPATSPEYAAEKFAANAIRQVVVHDDKTGEEAVYVRGSGGAGWTRASE